MSNRCLIIAAVAILDFVFAAGVRADAPVPPTPVDTGVKVSLFASEPDIVTPIGATIDSHGRLLVVESNTHFRPKDYKGPETDRILILQDTAGSGKADKVTPFYEGQKWMMNIAGDRDGSVVVSSRNEIFRLIPNDAGLAEKRVSLARLETKSDYPHNGLHGLALEKDGTIYFSIGENLGGPWTLVGTDGRTVSGSVGAGAIFRMDSQGNHLMQIARGFWNPFGMGIDPNGQVWALDNDPDGRPPCRLIDVAIGGDYGYEFRYGRTGLHPLQSWDAELPGTLGMVAGVGEAPCAVVWGRGRLFVSSWRDHEVQSYILTPRGATYTAAEQTIVHGGDSFRPVGLAFGPDGALYVTDWADKSYPVHGKGHVWKLTFASSVPESAPPVDEARKHAEQLRNSASVGDLLAAFDDVDPATQQAAEYGLSKLPDSEKVEWSSLKTPREKIGLLTALLLRGSDTSSDAHQALSDDSDRVRQMGVRCVTEQNIKSAHEDLDRLLKSQTLSPRLLGMTVAAINQLDGDPAAKIDSGKINQVLLARMTAADATDASRASALQMMQISHPHIALDELAKMLQSPLKDLQIQAARYLSNDQDAARLPILSVAAQDTKLDPQIRAECIVGLAADPAKNVDLLMKLAMGDEPTTRAEALLSLRPIAASLNDDQRKELSALAAKDTADADSINRLLMPGQVPPRPVETDEAAWQKIVAAAPGDPEAGRRIFFSPAGPGCYRCHVIEGRGHVIGPDLTMIGHSQTRDHVLESILEPSKEIAPLYTLWTISRKNGDPVTGMLLRRDGQSNEIYVDATGQETRVVESTVTDRKMRSESLMPPGLVGMMTDQELRDVVALLMQKR